MSMDNNGKDREKRPSKLKVWILASRPHTLTASIAPVLVGSSFVSWWKRNSLALSRGMNQDEIYSPSSHIFVSIVFAAFACLVQLGTNLHNDYADFVKGADTDKRVGQPRATQKGWLTTRETAGGASLCLCGATILGLILSTTSSSSTGSESVSWDKFMLFITFSSVFNAVAYTGGPYPLGYIGLQHLSIGYSGLGDLFVFLYFGLVATMTVPYLYLRNKMMDESHAEVLSIQFYLHHPLIHAAFMLALPIGFLATAIIVVNNLRDRKTDVLAGKKTMAVRLGETFARGEYTFLVLGSFLILPFLAVKFGSSILLPFLSVPVAIPQLQAVGFGGKDGGALNSHVGGTARLQLLFCVFLAIRFQLDI